MTRYSPISSNECYIHSTNTDLLQHFDETLRNRQLLSHPFYRRGEAGDLQRDELKHYAEQYRHFETMLPTFLEELSGQLLDGSAKDYVMANLADEVRPPSHLALFDSFARFCDAEATPMSPATTSLLNAYREVQRRGAVSALAGLLAYESQGAAIADSKAAGLKENYGASDDAITFWIEHGSVEADHATWTFDALSSLEPALDEVGEAARLVGDAWWEFLNERGPQNA
ncbi:MAG TPA: iron-containing redox enzyme family protein [Acidimicrobiales bacterium]|nr:iron-containing redox enzyme family protein [Acidimicrobiales bacterium]